MLCWDQAELSWSSFEIRSVFLNRKTVKGNQKLNFTCSFLYNKLVPKSKAVFIAVMTLIH